MSQEQSPEQISGKVLIVDDNIQNVELLQAYLEDLPVQTLVAVDGIDAMEKVHAHQPDIILLDIMMPKINGLDVLKKLKDSEETKSIPVIVLTALIQDREKMESITRGADDYIVKSETMPGDVIEKIKSVLASPKQPASEAKE